MTHAHPPLGEGPTAALLEQAVHTMTALPSARLALRDRSCLRVGCVGDVVIFDAATVRDLGTLEDPHYYPDGIPDLLLAGMSMVDGNIFTDAHRAPVILHPPRTKRAAHLSPSSKG
ncbi:MAG: hypothetical protein ABI910_21935 [Gemmatimonadota bacterium]